MQIIELFLNQAFFSKNSLFLFLKMVFKTDMQEAAKTPPDPHVGGRWVGGLEAASRICGSNNKELGVRIEPNGQKSTFLRPNKGRNVLL